MAWFKRESNPAADPQTDESKHTVRTEGLWLKCDGCREIIWKKDLESTLNTCGKCGHHFRMDARGRLNMLFDDGVYEEKDASLESTDPLGFVDSKSYKERLKATEEATSLKDALISGDSVSLKDARRKHLRCMEAEIHRRKRMGAVTGEKNPARGHREGDRSAHWRWIVVSASAARACRKARSA